MIVIKMRTNQYLCLKFDLHPLCKYIIVLGEIISHYNRYDASVLFKGLYSDRATKTTEGNYMMLCNSANLMAYENTV